MDNTADLVSQRAIYLYCLAGPECIAALPVEEMAGVDERFSVKVLLDGEHENQLVAVVSEVDPAEFSEQNLQSLSWLGARAQRHEAVVECMMAAPSILPVKFGTLFYSADSIAEFMRQHRTTIVSALSALRNKREWSVKGYLVEADALPLVVASNTDIQSRLATLSSSPGARYIQQRQLDAKIQAALQSWLSGMVREIHAALAVHAVDSTTLRCHSSSVTGRPERMFLNASFLLDAGALADFKGALEKLKLAFQGGGLTLELQGPWPPYNFCPALTEGKP